MKYLELGVGPSRDLNNHVEDGLLLVGIEGDIVEGRDGNAILLQVDTVFQGVRRSNLANAVGGCHLESVTGRGRGRLAGWAGRC